MIVIETRDKKVEWGISFTSHNPLPEDYFQCVSEDEAFRLKEKIESLLPSPNPQDVVCPFCSEDDFDLIGLKKHLVCYCEKYAETKSI